jgi:hypothetical protein
MVGTMDLMQRLAISKLLRVKSVSIARSQHVQKPVQVGYDPASGLGTFGPDTFNFLLKAAMASVVDDPK